ncbi:DUF1684 domain-containing protein [Actinomycetospora sp. NBRC 106378]|uniref:DUF1684 domain-containing protein n=1 Tax=Actinomycetospora sp. NBRC 106378 TaxID=3032208 RepID=UPI0024A46632|nr:DUF1684 domain-containing protein [Actinomycetospora sp. NBRC 106378]GLZ52580.1 hypothetical protein Acsp07_21970 [Actinomycetospora sp. NBRC 106378]
MTSVAEDLTTDWQRWHDEREAMLREPHGWLSLTALEWLDDTARPIADLPGTWRAAGDGTVEITAAAADGVVVDGATVDGTATVTPVDGAPGVLVGVGERVVELARRTDSYALRVRDPEAPTRHAFTGVPTFPVDERWVVTGRFEAYPEPRRITVGAVVDGLAHFPTAVGTVTFTLDGAEQQLIALAGKGEGLSLHFRDATSGVSTYGGGRILRTGDPDADGTVVVDLNRTVNLPCALTAFATCPLPPADNVLHVAVEAGERSDR